MTNVCGLKHLRIVFLSLDLFGRPATLIELARTSEVTPVKSQITNPIN